MNLHDPIDQHEATNVWLAALDKILTWGKDRAPRGKPTKNIQHNSLQVNMKKPVVLVPERKLSFQFMAAEAFWILTGDNRVNTIAPYNKNIAQFSDDGKIFAGAYGPMVVDQIDYVVEKLVEDPDTRQAALTIWRPSPEPSKDIPCTIAMVFERADGKLHTHVLMRSSDAWLGLPYDIFNFSMISYQVVAKVRAYEDGSTLEPGTLFLDLVSSHLYEQHFEAAKACVSSPLVRPQPEAPSDLWSPTMDLVGYLGSLRDTTSGDHRRWWEQNGERTGDEQGTKKSGKTKS